MASSGRAWGAFALITLIWGSTFLAIRVANQEGYDPFHGAAVRVAGAAALLLALAVAWRLPRPRGRDLAVTLLAGTLMYGLNFTLLFWGELTVPSSMAAVMWGIYPALVALGAAAFLEGDPLTRRGLGGALLAALGLVVVFWSHLTLAAPLLGFAAVLGGILSGTAASLMAKKWSGHVPAVAFNAWASVGGLLVTVPLSLAFGRGSVLPPSGLAWAALGYLVVFGTMAFTVWKWLLDRWPATRLSFQTVLSPLVALLLGAALLSEPVEATFLAGTALILGGTWLAVRPRPSAAPAPPTPPDAAIDDARAD